MGMHEPMSDVAAWQDSRGITIQQVGISGMYLPVQIRRMGGGTQEVVAKTSLAADLSHEFRGTHMSRFVAILNHWRERPIGSEEIGTILTEALTRLRADVAHLEMSFKYFLHKMAPASGVESLMDYDITFRGRRDAERYRFVLGVDVPVTALCPCSKEISRVGAHNQRAVIGCVVELHPGEIRWIEELVPMLEAQGSSQLYAMLKRSDEKYVTEYAYEHPKFVEDILRDVVTALRQDPVVHGFSVRVNSMESIHNHNVYAAHAEGLAPW